MTPRWSNRRRDKQEQRVHEVETQATFLLPGGYRAPDGELHREVELAPLSGREEERLAHCEPSTGGATLTMLLTSCVRRLGAVSPVSSDIVRRLLIADRHYLLLKLREATFGDRVQATVQCPWEECRKKVDIDFSLHDIPVRASEDKGPLYTRELSPAAAFSGERGEQYREVTFRLPTSEDQEVISHVVEDNEAQALALLLARCIRRLGPLHDPGPEVIHRLSPLARMEIERHLEEAAPQVDLTLAAYCPECEREFAVPFDLREFFLAECKTSCDLLYREVHYLAYHYHWSEQEIMTLPREKRRKYIAVLAEELRRVSHAV
ncbi:MAG: hypothetical protein HOP18_18585 [Deltaproteobacteria bacterium]|nr:hypothetical protein [Deltaproteobacteria bacterium]